MELSTWLGALRNSHDALTALSQSLDGTQLRQQSYCSQWSVADTLSHIGSGAEIFSLLVDAGINGTEVPQHEVFVSIWDRWNAATPEEQAAWCADANEQLVARLESAGQTGLADFHVSTWGMELDAETLCQMRLGEHAMHAWDVAYAFDSTATVAQDSVDLLIDHLASLVARSGKPLSEDKMLRVTTTNPDRDFALELGGVAIAPWAGEQADGSLQLPAEVFLRLVYSRLENAQQGGITLNAPEVTLSLLQTVFPGF